VEGEARKSCTDALVNSCGVVVSFMVACDVERGDALDSLRAWTPWSGVSQLVARQVRGCA
jgi:hypothetical protein